MATILILDEEADSCMLLKRLLERSADHVIVFVDTDEALQFAASNAVDMAIVNVASRHCHSLAVPAELKSVSSGIKVMVISNYLLPEPGDATAADCFLLKPMDIDAVEKKVRELLKARSSDLTLGSKRNCNITGSFNK